MAKTDEEILLLENVKGTVSYMLYRNEHGRIQVDVFSGGEWRKMPGTKENHKDFFMMHHDTILIDER